MPTTENKSLGHECVIASPDKYNKKHRTKGYLTTYFRNRQTLEMCNNSPTVAAEWQAHHLWRCILQHTERKDYVPKDYIEDIRKKLFLDLHRDYCNKSMVIGKYPFSYYFEKTLIVFVEEALKTPTKNSIIPTLMNIYYDVAEKDRSIPSDKVGFIATVATIFLLGEVGAKDANVNSEVNAMIDELSKKLGKGIRLAIDQLKNQDIDVEICSKLKDDLKEVFEAKRIIENWFIKCGEENGASYLEAKEIVDSDDECNFVPSISNVKIEANVKEELIVVKNEEVGVIDLTGDKIKAWLSVEVPTNMKRRSNEIAYGLRRSSGCSTSGKHTKNTNAIVILSDNEDANEVVSHRQKIRKLDNQSIKNSNVKPITRNYCNTSKKVESEDRVPGETTSNVVPSCTTTGIKPGDETSKLKVAIKNATKSTVNFQGRATDVITAKYTLPESRITHCEVDSCKGNVGISASKSFTQIDIAKFEDSKIGNVTVLPNKSILQTHVQESVEKSSSPSDKNNSNFTNTADREKINNIPITKNPFFFDQETLSQKAGILEDTTLRYERKDPKSNTQDVKLVSTSAVNTENIVKFNEDKLLIQSIESNTCKDAVTSSVETTKFGKNINKLETNMDRNVQTSQTLSAAVTLPDQSSLTQITKTSNTTKEDKIAIIRTEVSHSDRSTKSSVKLNKKEILHTPSNKESVSSAIQECEESERKLETDVNKKVKPAELACINNEKSKTSNVGEVITLCDEITTKIGKQDVVFVIDDKIPTVNKKTKLTVEKLNASDGYVVVINENDSEREIQQNIDNNIKNNTEIQIIDDEDDDDVIFIDCDEKMSVKPALECKKEPECDGNIVSQENTKYNEAEKILDVAISVDNNVSFSADGKQNTNASKRDTIDENNHNIQIERSSLENVSSSSVEPVQIDSSKAVDDVASFFDNNVSFSADGSHNINASKRDATNERNNVLVEKSLLKNVSAPAVEVAKIDNSKAVVSDVISVDNNVSFSADVKQNINVSKRGATNEKNHIHVENLSASGMEEVENDNAKPVVADVTMSVDNVVADVTICVDNNISLSADGKQSIKPHKRDATDEKTDTRVENSSVENFSASCMDVVKSDRTKAVADVAISVDNNASFSADVKQNIVSKRDVTDEKNHIRVENCSLENVSVSRIEVVKNSSKVVAADVGISVDNNISLSADGKQNISASKKGATDEKTDSCVRVIKNYSSEGVADVANSVDNNTSFSASGKQIINTNVPDKDHNIMVEKSSSENVSTFCVEIAKIDSSKVVDNVANTDETQDLNVREIVESIDNETKFFETENIHHDKTYYDADFVVENVEEVSFAHIEGELNTGHLGDVEISCSETVVSTPELSVAEKKAEVYNTVNYSLACIKEKTEQLLTEEKLLSSLLDESNAKSTLRVVTASTKDVYQEPHSGNSNEDITGLNRKKDKSQSDFARFLTSISNKGNKKEDNITPSKFSETDENMPSDKMSETDDNSMNSKESVNSKKDDSTLSDVSDGGFSDWEESNKDNHLSSKSQGSTIKDRDSAANESTYISNRDKRALKQNQSDEKHKKSSKKSRENKSSTSSRDRQETESSKKKDYYKSNEKANRGSSKDRHYRGLSKEYCRSSSSEKSVHGSSREKQSRGSSKEKLSVHSSKLSKKDIRRSLSVEKQRCDSSKDVHSSRKSSPEKQRHGSDLSKETSRSDSKIKQNKKSPKEDIHELTKEKRRDSSNKERRDLLLEKHSNESSKKNRSGVHLKDTASPGVKVEKRGLSKEKQYYDSPKEKISSASIGGASVGKSQGCSKDKHSSEPLKEKQKQSEVKQNSSGSSKDKQKHDLLKGKNNAETHQRASSKEKQSIESEKEKLSQKLSVSESHTSLKENQPLDVCKETNSGDSFVEKTYVKEKSNYDSCAKEKATSSSSKEKQKHETTNTQISETLQTKKKCELSKEGKSNESYKNKNSSLSSEEKSSNMLSEENELHKSLKRKGQELSKDKKEKKDKQSCELFKSSTSKLKEGENNKTSMAVNSVDSRMLNSDEANIKRDLKFNKNNSNLQTVKNKPEKPADNSSLGSRTRAQTMRQRRMSILISPEIEDKLSCSSSTNTKGETIRNKNKVIDEVQSYKSSKMADSLKSEKCVSHTETEKRTDGKVRKKPGCDKDDVIICECVMDGNGKTAIKLQGKLFEGEKWKSTENLDKSSKSEKTNADVSSSVIHVNLETQTKHGMKNDNVIEDVSDKRLVLNLESREEIIDNSSTLITTSQKSDQACDLHCIQENRGVKNTGMLKASSSPNDLKSVTGIPSKRKLASSEIATHKTTMKLRQRHPEVAENQKKVLKMQDNNSEQNKTFSEVISKNDQSYVFNKESDTKDQTIPVAALTKLEKVPVEEQKICHAERKTSSRIKDKKELVRDGSDKSIAAEVVNKCSQQQPGIPFLDGTKCEDSGCSSSVQLAMNMNNTKIPSTDTLPNKRNIKVTSNQNKSNKTDPILDVLSETEKYKKREKHIPKDLKLLVETTDQGLSTSDKELIAQIELPQVPTSSSQIVSNFEVQTSTTANYNVSHFVTDKEQKICENKNPTATISEGSETANTENELQLAQKPGVIKKCAINDMLLEEKDDKREKVKVSDCPEKKNEAKSVKNQLKKLSSGKIKSLNSEITNKRESTEDRTKIQSKDTEQNKKTLKQQMKAPEELIISRNKNNQDNNKSVLINPDEIISENKHLGDQKTATPKKDTKSPNQSVKSDMLLQKLIDTLPLPDKANLVQVDISDSLHNISKSGKKQVEVQHSNILLKNSLRDQGFKNDSGCTSTSLEASSTANKVGECGINVSDSLFPPQAGEFMHSTQDFTLNVTKNVLHSVHTNQNQSNDEYKDNLEMLVETAIKTENSSAQSKITHQDAGSGRPTEDSNDSSDCHLIIDENSQHNVSNEECEHIVGPVDLSRKKKHGETVKTKAQLKWMDDSTSFSSSKTPNTPHSRKRKNASPSKRVIKYETTDSEEEIPPPKKGRLPKKGQKSKLEVHSVEILDLPAKLRKRNTQKGGSTKNENSEKKRKNQGKNKTNLQNPDTPIFKTGMVGKVTAAFKDIFNNKTVKFEEGNTSISLENSESENNVSVKVTETKKRKKKVQELLSLDESPKEILPKKDESLVKTCETAITTPPVKKVKLQENEDMIIPCRRSTRISTKSDESVSDDKSCDSLPAKEKAQNNENAVKKRRILRKLRISVSEDFNRPTKIDQSDKIEQLKININLEPVSKKNNTNLKQPSKTQNAKVVVELIDHNTNNTVIKPSKNNNLLRSPDELNRSLCVSSGIKRKRQLSFLYESTSELNDAHVINNNKENAAKKIKTDSKEDAPKIHSESIVLPAEKILNVPKFDVNVKKDNAKDISGLQKECLVEPERVLIHAAEKKQAFKTVKEDVSTTQGDNVTTGEKQCIVPVNDIVSDVSMLQNKMPNNTAKNSNNFLSVLSDIQSVTKNEISVPAVENYAVSDVKVTGERLCTTNDILNTAVATSDLMNPAPENLHDMKEKLTKNNDCNDVIIPQEKIDIKDETSSTTEEMVNKPHCKRKLFYNIQVSNVSENIVNDENVLENKSLNSTKEEAAPQDKLKKMGVIENANENDSFIEKIPVHKNVDDSVINDSTILQGSSLDSTVISMPENSNVGMLAESSLNANEISSVPCSFTRTVTPSNADLLIETVTTDTGVLSTSLQGVSTTTESSAPVTLVNCPNNNSFTTYLSTPISQTVTNSLISFGDSNTPKSVVSEHVLPSVDGTGFDTRVPPSTEAVTSNKNFNSYSTSEVLPLSVQESVISPLALSGPLPAVSETILQLSTNECIKPTVCGAGLDISLPPISEVSTSSNECILPPFDFETPLTSDVPSLDINDTTTSTACEIDNNMPSTSTVVASLPPTLGIQTDMFSTVTTVASSSSTRDPVLANCSTPLFPCGNNLDEERSGDVLMDGSSDDFNSQVFTAPPVSTFVSSCLTETICTQISNAVQVEPQGVPEIVLSNLVAEFGDDMPVTEVMERKGDDHVIVTTDDNVDEGGELPGGPMFHNEEKKTTSNDDLSNIMEDKTKSNSKSVSEENQGSSISEDTPLEENYMYEFETLSSNNYEGLVDDSLVFNKYSANQVTGTEDKYSLASAGELYLIMKEHGGVLNQQTKVKEEIVDFQETPIEGFLRPVIDQSYHEQIQFNVNTQNTPQTNHTGNVRDDTFSFKSIVLPQYSSDTSTVEVEKGLSNMLASANLQPVSVTGIITNIDENTGKQYVNDLETSTLTPHIKNNVCESSVTFDTNQRPEAEKAVQLPLVNSDPSNVKENTGSIEKEQLSHVKQKNNKPEKDVDETNDEAVAQILQISRQKNKSPEKGETDVKEAKVSDSPCAETKYNLRHAKGQSDNGNIRDLFVNFPAAHGQSSSLTPITHTQERVSCENAAVQKSKNSTLCSKDKTQTSTEKPNITQKSPKGNIDYSALHNKGTIRSATYSKPQRKSPRRISIDDVADQCIKRTWSIPKRVPTTRKGPVSSGEKNSTQCAKTDVTKHADPYAFHSDSEESVIVKEGKHVITKSSGKDNSFAKENSSRKLDNVQSVTHDKSPLRTNVDKTEKPQSPATKVPEKVQTPTPPKYSRGIDPNLSKNTPKRPEDKLFHSPRNGPANLQKSPISDRNMHNAQHRVSTPKCEPVQQGSQHHLPPTFSHSMEAILQKNEKSAASRYPVNDHRYKHPAPANQRHSSRNYSQRMSHSGYYRQQGQSTISSKHGPHTQQSKSPTSSSNSDKDWIQSVDPLIMARFPAKEQKQNVEFPD